MDAQHRQMQIQVSPPDSDDVGEQKEFGDVGDFWAKYDDLANKFDDEMIARLNGNLDVLLIFAGLFSAVDTAFIVVAIAALSAGPADQTNHLLRLILTNGINITLTPSQLNPPSFAPSRFAVRQNCFFFASLGFGLLAAAGAVLAKQWLQYYQRRGQTGPIRKQGMRRTKKFVGAEAWKLSHIAETLLVLILISLAFFSTALADYLWAVDRSVAIVVTALTTVGFLAYGFTLVAGIMSGACPFQTSFSKSVRKLLRKDLPDTMDIFGPPGTLITRGRLFIIDNIRAAYNRLRHRDTWNLSLERSVDVVLGVLPTASRLAAKTPAAVVSTIADRFRLADLDSNVKNDHWIYACSAVWMLETAPEKDNILAIAQNLPYISDFDVMQIIASSHAFRLLLLQFRASIIALHDDRTSACTASAIVMARAVSHVALADPVHTANALCKVFEHFGSLDWLAAFCGPTWKESEELMILLISIASAYQCADRQSRPETLQLVEAALHRGLNRCTRKGAAATTELHQFILTTPSSTNSWEDTHRKIDEIGKTLLLEGVKFDTAYANCASRALTLTLRTSPATRDQHSYTQQQPIEKARTAWEIRTASSLAENLPDVIDTLSEYYRYARTSTPPLGVYPPLLHYQRQLLIHGKKLYFSKDLIVQLSRKPDPSAFQRMHSTLNFNIEELIAMKGPALQASTDSPVRHCQIELVEFLRGLLLTPGPQWHDVETEALEATARLARHLEGLEADHLSEAILYRYFVHIQRDLYSTRSNSPRHAKISHDVRIGPVLISSLRLYLWLYPSTNGLERWSHFGRYLRSLAIGQVLPGDHPHLIGWIPVVITHDSDIPAPQCPRIFQTLDPRRRSVPTNDVSSLAQ
ncbi:hypothetical protein FRB94_009359 [Tulasnella sp. JGI-2019a]|nr:hypothetical protein FRB94_009359 [Tulasnella sp. JGI-2019a]